VADKGMPKKSQDAFLQFLKKKRKEVSKKQVREERGYQAPIEFNFKDREVNFGDRSPKAKTGTSQGKLIFIAFLFLIMACGALLFFYLRERLRTDELLRVVAQTEKEISSIAEDVPRQTIRSTQTSLAETQQKLKLTLADRVVGSKPAPSESKPASAPSEVQEKVPPSAPVQEKIPEKSAPAPEKVAPPAPAASAPEKASAPTTPSAPSQPEKGELKTAALAVPSGQTLYPFVHVDGGEKVILVEKNTKTLFLFNSVQGKLTLAKSYPCLVGRNIKDKEKTGDMATPEGVYYLVEFIPANKLSEIYGMGAFVLNYPDFLDKKEGKTGDGVWLHGHDPKKKLEEVQSSKGCVVMSNDHLRELSTLIKLGTTPIVIVDKVAFRSGEGQKKLAQELLAFTTSWQKAWEDVDMKKFLRFYSKDFVSADGKDLETFAQRKEKVSKEKKFIRLKLDRRAILLPQKYQGDVAIIRFRQVYRSSNFSSISVKSLYLRKGPKGWQITGESVLPS
jgi:murein L,D-transpeptidase YafK